MDMKCIHIVPYIHRYTSEIYVQTKGFIVYRMLVQNLLLKVICQTTRVYLRANLSKKPKNVRSNLSFSINLRWFFARLAEQLFFQKFCFSHSATRESQKGKKRTTFRSSNLLPLLPLFVKQSNRATPNVCSSSNIFLPLRSSRVCD